MNASKPMSAACRVELFSKKNVTVFCDQFESRNFARHLASIKSLQADSRAFYVMDVSRVNALLDIWQNVLPRVRPFYAVNCNADDVLLGVLADRVDVGLQCRTRENVKKALEYVAPERVLYANACWTRSTAAYACATRVRRVSFESASDLTRLLGAVASTKSEIELILNVCVNTALKDDDEDVGCYADEDVEASFGCALADAAELIRLAAEMGSPCAGLAFHIGQGGTPARYQRAIAKMAALFGVARDIGAPMRILNLGGDFCTSGNALDFAEICEQINHSLDVHFPPNEFPNLEIIATPGRFIAESAFALITNVVGRRRASDFDINSDAYIYETNESYYGSFGCQINANCNPRCAPLFDYFTDGYAYSAVSGPTTGDERFDLLETRCRLPTSLRVGDWLLWENMGAYTLNNCDDDDASSFGYGETKFGGIKRPSIFYFTSQRDWDRLIGAAPTDEQPKPSSPTLFETREVIENHMTMELYPPWTAAYFDDADDSSDEGIRSASPSSLADSDEEELSPFGEFLSFLL